MIEEFRKSTASYHNGDSMKTSALTELHTYTQSEGVNVDDIIESVETLNHELDTLSRCLKEIDPKASMRNKFGCAGHSI